MSQLDNMTLPQKVLELIAVADTLNKQANVTEQAQQEKQAQIQAKIPEIVETMVEHGRIDPSDREKLASRLTDPVATLDLLAQVSHHAIKKAEAAPTRLGKAASTKSANQNSRMTYVGQRTTQETAASRGLFSDLGLPAPTE